MFGRPGSIQLARVFGIRIGVDFSWFLVLFLVIFWLSDAFRDALDSSDTTAYLTAVVSALLLFASIVVHELGHALVARRHGIEVAGITISPLGGYALMSREARSAGEELKVAAAGPLATLAVIVVCVAVDSAIAGPNRFLDAARLSSDVEVTPVLLTLSWLVSMNAIVLVFNLIPAYPLDGGRILRAIVWGATGDRGRGTRVAGRMGQGLAVLMVVAGGWALVALSGSTGIIVGIWLAFVGLMIGGAARAMLAHNELTEQLEDVSVVDIMDADPVSVPEELSAERALDEFFLRYRWPWFPVVDGAGRYVGVLREERARGAVEGDGTGGPASPVRELMEGDPGGRWRIGDDATLRALIDSDGLRSLGALMVLDGAGVLRGVVTVGRLRRALRTSVLRHT